MEVARRVFVRLRKESEEGCVGFSHTSVLLFFQNNNLVLPKILNPPIHPLELIKAMEKVDKEESRDALEINRSNKENARAPPSPFPFEGGGPGRSLYLSPKKHYDCHISKD